MKKAPTKFNKKMKEAAAAGELDKNPKFKKAVMDSPAMLKKSMAKLKKSMAQLKGDEKSAMMLKKKGSAMMLKTKKSMAMLKKKSAMMMKKMSSAVKMGHKKK
jgi:hypothetical protein